MKRFLPTLAFAILLLSACAPAAAPVRVFRDIVYAAHAGADPNLTSLDIYSPVGKDGCPVILWIHGGGWQAGDKTDLIEQKSDYFVSQGFVFASANHRLFPEAEFPVFVRDIADAVAWVKDNIEGYGGDPQRVILIGFSSGAHIAALLVTDSSYLSAHGIRSDEIEAVVAVDSAAYDLPLLSKYYKGKLEGTHGFVFGGDPALWRAASPVTFLENARGIPPILLVYSRGVYEDQVNPNFKEQAEHFADALQQSGYIVSLASFQKETHQELDENLGLPYDPLTGKIMAFLRETAGMNLSCKRETP